MLCTRTVLSALLLLCLSCCKAGASLQGGGLRPLQGALSLPEMKEWLRRAAAEQRRKFEKARGSIPSREDVEFMANLDKHNREAMKLLLSVSKSTKGWTFVNEKDGVTVEKCFLPAGSFVSERDRLKGSKHACVKSSAVLDAPPAAIYKLFLDNSRVAEYNEHIKEVRDVQYMPDKASKIAWCVGPSYGPFAARDFCSVVNFTKRGGGGYIILNRPAYHSQFPESQKCVRATILLAGNIIEPHGRGRSLVTQIAHVNPGGGADNKVVASVINRLCAVGPPVFLRKLEAAAKKKV